MLVFAISVLLNAACTKKSSIKDIQDELVTKKEDPKNQTAGKGGITTNSVPLYCEDLENPCTDPACQPYYDCEEASLATRIAEHQSFINLNLNFNQALSMPTPNTFTELFDTAQLSSQGNSYLSSITGISVATITSINNAIQTNAQSMITSFPELTNKSKAELDSIFLEATDIYLSSSQARVPCKECRRIGRRNMIVGIFMGAASGSSWGFFGAWAGATLGFWIAADDALTCLKDCTS